MINVGQLNDTIDELEKEIQNIKSISEVYKKLSKLSEEVKANKKLHDMLVKETSKTSKQIEKTSTALINAVDKSNHVLEEMGVTIDENLIDISEESKAAIKRLMDGYKKYELDMGDKLINIESNLNRQYEDFTQSINSKYDKLNEEYINEIAKLKEIIALNEDKLNKVIMEQLDENARKIGSEIKNSNYEIQNSLVNFITSKIENVDTKIALKQKQDQANTNLMKILLSISIITSAISIVIAVAK